MIDNPPVLMANMNDSDETNDTSDIDLPPSEEIEEATHPVALQRVFGDNARTAIISALTVAEDYLNKTEIADRAGVSPRTVRRNLGFLQEMYIIEEVPLEDGYMGYKLNSESDVAREIWQLQSTILEDEFY